MRRLVIIANPATPRARAFLEAARAFAGEVELVSWAQVLRDGGLTRDEPAVVRIDSPGNDDAVHDRLLALGEGVRREHGFGEIRSPACTHRGLVRALDMLAASFARQPELVPWVAPERIGEMFDKVETRRALAESGVSTVPSLPAPASPAALYEALSSAGWSRAYVKLRAGSCAAGIVLLDAPKRSGLSTVLPAAGRLFNTRRVCRLEGAELEGVLAFILREGASVERAVPLAEIDGEPFDVRVVVVAGEPAFAIFRRSPIPITNLHLGGRRADPDRGRVLIGRRLWLEALDDCVRAAARFEARTVGIDVLFDRPRVRHYLLELNPFGDFFPGWRESGRTIHRAVVDALNAFDPARSMSPGAGCPRAARAGARGACPAPPRSRGPAARHGEP